jgi:tetratricopeptide (TPR) repeat protein
MRRVLVLQDREVRWARQVDAELGNLRAALQAAQQPHSAELGLRIISALHRYWYQAMLWRETVERIERLLAAASALGEEPTPAQALGCYVAGMLATNYDPVAGRRFCNEGLARARRIGFEEGIAKCTMWLAHLDARQRNPANRDLFRACLSMGPRIPDDLERAQFLMLTLVCKAGFEALMHRDEEAEAAVAECERVNDSIGGVYLFRGHCRALLGTLATRRGDLSLAERRLGESLAFYRAIGSTFDVAGSLVQQGFLALRLGRPQEALALFKESLPLHGTYIQSPWVTRSLAHLTIALAACQRWGAAARLAGALGRRTDAANAQQGIPSVISGAVAQAYEGALNDAFRALGLERSETELTAGANMSREDVIAFALAAEPHE